MGDLALGTYSRAGVDLSAVSRDSTTATGIILVATVPGGERTMFSNRGANARLSPDDIIQTGMDGARILQLTGYAFLESPQRDAALKAIDMACASGIPISLDLSITPTGISREHVLRLLEKLDICILGVEEARELLGAQDHAEAARALIERGVSTAAVKLGSRGSFLATREESLSIPGVPVNSVDTTGAGDAFSAGLLFGRVQGLSLGASGLLASALGGLATEVRGAGPSLPGREELLPFLRELNAGGLYPDLDHAFAEVIDSMEKSMDQQCNDIEEKAG